MISAVKKQRIALLDRPYIIEQSLNVTVLMGDIARFRCGVSSEVPPSWELRLNIGI